MPPRHRSEHPRWMAMRKPLQTRGPMTSRGRRRAERRSAGAQRRWVLRCGLRFRRVPAMAQAGPPLSPVFFLSRRTCRKRVATCFPRSAALLTDRVQVPRTYKTGLHLLLNSTRVVSGGGRPLVHSRALSGGGWSRIFATEIGELRLLPPSRQRELCAQRTTLRFC